MGAVQTYGHGPKLGAPIIDVIFYLANTPLQHSTSNRPLGNEWWITWYAGPGLFMFFPNRHCWHQSTHKIHQCSTSSIHFSGLMHSTVTIVWGVPHTKYQCRLPRIMAKGWTASEKENWLKQISLGKKTRKTVLCWKIPQKCKWLTSWRRLAELSSAVTLPETTMVQWNMTPRKQKKKLNHGHYPSNLALIFRSLIISKTII